MKALSLLPALRSLVFGCAVLVVTWLVLALSAGGTYAAPKPGVDLVGQAPGFAGCWSPYSIPVVPNVFTHVADVDALSPSNVWTAGTQGTASGGTRPRIHHWNGSAWSIVLSPTGLGDQTGLATVDAVAPNDVWVGGVSDGVSFVMRWNGIDWSIIPTPNIGAINEISALSGGDVWAISYTRTMHWNGSQWTVYDFPQYENFRGLTIKAVAPNEVWAGGGVVYSPTQLLRWNGTQWNIVYVSGPLTTASQFTDFNVVAPNDIWAVGNYNTSTSGTLALTAHWNGTQWTVVPAPAPLEYVISLQGVSGASSTDVWAVGSVENRGEPLAFHWNGVQWSIATPPGVPPSSQFMAVSAALAGDVWAVGYYPGTPVVMRFTDPCAPPSPTPVGTATPTPDPMYTATRTPTPTTTATYIPPAYCWASQVLQQPPDWQTSSLGPVSASASDNVWALGEATDTTGASLWITRRWDGSSWSINPIDVALDTDRLYDILALSPSDVWVVGASWERTLTLHWDGLHWSHVPSPPNPISNTNAELRSIDAAGPGDVWAVGNYSNEYYVWPIILRWNGTSWSYGTTPEFADGLQKVKVISANDVWVGGYDVQAGVWSGRVSRWNGNAWITIQGDGESVTALDASGPNDVWFGTSNRRFQHWNGSAWSIVSSLGYEVWDISAAATNEKWAVTQGGILHGSGVRWESAPYYGPQGTLRGVEAIALGEAWAVGQSGGETLVAHYSSACAPATSPTPGPSQTPTVTPTATNTPLPPRCPTERFTDVCPSDYFYEPVLYLNDREIISGYNTAPPCDGAAHIPCFKPYNGSTRGQIAKIVSIGAGFGEPVPETRRTFEDVPYGHTFWEYIERMAARDIIQGYACGGTGEPCGPLNRPYFRANNPVTRGQLSKMTANAFNYFEPVTGQTFEDVVVGSTFYEYVQRIAARSIIQGYQCGGEGEPCVPPGNRPYFRPNSHVTRGQTAKIVHLAMLQPGPTATPTQTIEPTPTRTPRITPSPTATPTDPTCQGIPPSYNMEILPSNCVPAGTHLDFTGSGFLPGEDVSALAIDPNGLVIAFPGWIQADANGRAGPIGFNTTPDYPTGIWEFRMVGATSSAYAWGYFRLTVP